MQGQVIAPNGHRQRDAGRGSRSQRAFEGDAQRVHQIGLDAFDLGTEAAHRQIECSQTVTYRQQRSAKSGHQAAFNPPRMGWL